MHHLPQHLNMARRHCALLLLLPNCAARPKYFHAWPRVAARPTTSMPGGSCEHCKRRRDCTQCMSAATCVHKKRKRDCGECCQTPCEHGQVPRRCTTCKTQSTQSQSPRGMHRGPVAAGFMWSADLGFAIATMDSMAMGNRASAFALAVATPASVASMDSMAMGNRASACALAVARPASAPPPPPPPRPPPPPPPLALPAPVQSLASPTPTTVSLPAVLACPAVSLPAIVSLVNRPGPPLPTQTADGLPLPRDCFNPYDEAAPKGTFARIAKHVTRNAYALLGLPQDAAPPLLMIQAHEIAAAMDLDTLMQQGGYGGFCVHTARDVILCCLNPELSAKTFTTIAQMRHCSWVMDEATAMIPLIAQSAKDLGGTHTIFDDYTTRFGYRCRWRVRVRAFPLASLLNLSSHTSHLTPRTSHLILTSSSIPPHSSSPPHSTNQLSKLGTAAAGETLSRAIVRGGVGNIHFKNIAGPSLGSSRAAFREQLVQDAKKASRYFRNKWVPHGRPRVTGAFRTDCEWIRAPFSLRESLPLQSDIAQVRLATWETTLRGVEEQLMLSIWGSLPNVTWARVLAKVLEKAQHCMGDFDVDNYRQWAHATWRHAHGVGPGRLGCPWKGGGGRILPKGAAGIQPAKEMHDDDNGMICLGCWSSITEADTETDLCFLINGHEVFLRASAPRNVLFMGYIPHESRPADPSQPATKPRVHHSSFAKPEAEHLAASILSSLPCRGPWRMGDRKLLRPEAFSEDGMRPILGAGAEEARDRVLLV